MASTKKHQELVPCLRVAGGVDSIARGGKLVNFKERPVCTRSRHNNASWPSGPTGVLSFDPSTGVVEWERNYFGLPHAVHL